MKKIAFILALVPIVLVLPQLAAQAQTQCIDSNCQIRFDHTGDWQEWDVPDGAKNISVQLYGAQGGKSGGRGGELKARISQEIPAKLFVFVGGAGSSGALAPGGFNGGGQAGSAHGDEGSGGGATDIRISLSVQDRILVAGGGGGTGGWSGGQGGNGGGLTGQDGNAGQGGSGRGGSQFSGGTPGSSNGGYLGTSGGFGYGGSGGISNSAGGGGGGGGYFGGGGGGADVDSCCSDGGGGGGGSSWAYDRAEEVVSTQGVNQGNGYAIISYQLDYKIISSSISQISPESFELNLQLNNSLQLALTDFVVQEGCLAELSSVDNMKWKLLVSNCAYSQSVVQLVDGSGTLATKFPNLPMSFTLDMDLAGPELFVMDGPEHTNSNDAIFNFSLNEVISEFPEEKLELDGCESLSVTQTVIGFQMFVSACHEGVASVRLPARSLQDRYGNSGPLSDAYWTWTIDQTGPDVEFESSDPGDQAPFTFNLTVFADGIEITDHSKFLLDEGATGCIVNLEGPLLTFAECQDGMVTYTVPAQSLADELGNLGPKNDQVFTIYLDSPEPSTSSTPPNRDLIFEPEADDDPIFDAPVELAPEPPAIDAELPIDELVPITENEGLGSSEQGFSEDFKLFKPEPQRDTTLQNSERQTQDSQSQRTQPSESELDELQAAPSHPQLKPVFAPASENLTNPRASQWTLWPTIVVSLLVLTLIGLGIMRLSGK